MLGATTKTSRKKSSIRVPGVRFHPFRAGPQALAHQPDGRAVRIPAVRVTGLVCLLLWLLLGVRALAVEGEFAARFLDAFRATQNRYQAQPQNPTNAWEFAHACFDLGDYATNNAERAAIAEQGIAAARQAIALNTNAAEGPYNLGLNFGQLARTKTLGALRLVVQMEHEFSIASQLDPKLDYAGPDRCLGVLYRDAPSFGSIGSRSRARQHLLRALELAPNYPENRLNLIESHIKWNERNAARRELATLEASWNAAQKEFTGPAWAPNWADWTSRLHAAEKILGEPPKPLAAPRH